MSNLSSRIRGVDDSRRRRRFVLWALVGSVVPAVGSCTVAPPEVLWSTLPNAVEGAPYEQALGVAVGRGLTWTVVDGTLPDGLRLERSTGRLRGTPRRAGTFDFLVAIGRRGLGSRLAEQLFTLTVLPRLVVTPALPIGRVGERYDAPLDIRGGVPPYSVAIVGLPGGLDYDRTTGRVFGTPQFDYTGLPLLITVTDRGAPSQTVEARGTLVIRPRGVAIATDMLPPAAYNVPYGVTLIATDGRRPYVWSVVEGVLPDGLRLSRATGTIAGVPTARAQTREFRVEVADADTPPSRDTRAYRLVVPVVLLTASLPGGTVGQAYSQTLAAAAGRPPYTWQIVSGTLPEGLALDPVSGVLSGTPAVGAAGANFTVRVSDADNPATFAERTFTIAIQP